MTKDEIEALRADIRRFAFDGTGSSRFAGQTLWDRCDDLARFALAADTRATDAEAEAAQLRADLEAARAREAGLRDFLDDFAKAKIEALRFPPPDSPEDELDPVVEASEVWAWQEDAKAALASAPAQTDGETK